MSEIWDRLREERVRLGKSQEKFGAIGGVARNAQSNYEKGSRLPDARYLAAVADAGADIQYILTGERSDTSLPRPNIEEAVLLEAYRMCTETNRTHLLAVGQALAQLVPKPIKG